MATRSLSINTKVKGVPATLRNIKKIDDALDQSAANAKKVSEAMGEIRVSGGAVANTKALAESVSALSAAASRMQDQMASAARGIDRMGRNGAKSMNVVAKGAVGLNASLELVAKGLRAAGAAVDLLAFPAKLAVDWEYGIAKIRAVALGLPDDFGTALSDLAAKVPQSQAQLLRAAEDLARAGVEGGKIVPQLQVASRLAVAAGSDLETASSTIRLASTAWEKFGLTTAQAGDILFEVTRQAPLGLEDLQKNLGKIATMSSELNIPLQEATAQIAALAKAGIDVETGTTQIRGMYSALLSVGTAGPKLQKALASMFGTFAEAKRQIGPAAIQTEGLATVLQRLNRASGGNIEVMRAAFPNIRAFSGALVLAKDNARDFTSILAAVNNSSGSVAEGFDTMGNTVQGSINRFKASFEGAALEIGNALMPAIIEQFGRLEAWWQQNGPQIVKQAKQLASELATWVSDDFIPRFMDLLGDVKNWWDANGENITRLIGNLAAGAAKLLGIAAKFAAAIASDTDKARVDAITGSVKNFAAGIDSMSASIKKLPYEELVKRETKVRAQILATEEAIRKKNLAIPAGAGESLRAWSQERDALERQLLGWKRINKEIATNISLKGFGPFTEGEQQISDFFGAIGQGAASAVAELNRLNNIASDPEALAKALTGKAPAPKKASTAAGKATGKSWMEGFLSGVEKTTIAEGLADKLKLGGEGDLLQELFPEDYASNELMTLGDSFGQAFSRGFAVAKDSIADFTQQLIADQAYWENSLSAVAATVQQMGHDLANAAIGALFFGESFEAAINQALSAVFRQAAVETLKELALGFASLALGPIGGASATAHFKSAALWGALAVGAGAGAAVTGGVGASGGGGGGGAAASTPSSTPRPRERDTSSDAAQGGITINFGGTMPLATKDDIGRAIVEALEPYSRRRGRARADLARFSRR